MDAVHGIGCSDQPHDRDWWARRLVGELQLTTPVTVTPEVTCKEAVGILQSLGFDQLPVVGVDNSVLGVVTEGNLTAKLMSGRVRPADPVTKALYPQFRTVTAATSLSELARLFDRDHFAVVSQTQRVFLGGDAGTRDRSVVVGVVSRIDLLKYITSHAPDGGLSSPLPSPFARAAAARADGSGANPPTATL